MQGVQLVNHFTEPSMVDHACRLLSDRKKKKKKLKNNFDSTRCQKTKPHTLENNVIKHRNWRRKRKSV